MTRISDWCCPNCGILMLEENIYMESSKPNPYGDGKYGEFKFAYVWYWCTVCLFTEKDVKF